MTNDNRASIRVPAVTVAILCLVGMLLGTYVLVATIWVLAQLAEPGAASVPRYWMKSLFRFPLRTTLYTAPTALSASVACTVAWLGIRGKTIVGWRDLFAFAGLTAISCWLIRLVMQIVFQRQSFMRSPVFDLISLLASAILVAGAVGLWSRRSTG